MRLSASLGIPELADRLSAVHERVTEASSMLESLRLRAAVSMSEGVAGGIDCTRSPSIGEPFAEGQTFAPTWHLASAALAKAPVRLPAVEDPSVPPQMLRTVLFKEEVVTKVHTDVTTADPPTCFRRDVVRYTMGGSVDLRTLGTTFGTSESDDDETSSRDKMGRTGSEFDPRRGSVFGATGMGLRTSAVSQSQSTEGRPRRPSIIITDQVSKLKAAMVKPRNRDPRRGLLINPASSQFLKKWDMLTMLALAFIAFVAPVQVAMLESKFDGLFGINSVIDVMFFVDLILQFFLMYPKKTDWGDEWEQNHRKIVHHYLRTWFAVDFLSIIPFDLVALVSQSNELKRMKVVKVIRLMRLLKLVRVVKASRLFRRFEVRMSMTYGTVALIKFFAILMVITHWLANLWALTLVFVEESEGVPRWVDKFDALEENVETKTKNTPWKLYAHCLYFTSYTITSVGYGDIGPQNVVETIVCTIIIVMSGISWAVVLGQVCGIISQFNSDAQAFRSTMDELNRMMKDRGFSRSMQLKLRHFFLSNRLWASRARYQRIIEGLSPGLRGEVLMKLNRVWIEKVSFLNSILEEAELSNDGSYFYSFVVDIVMKMEGVFHAQTEVFGEFQALYILNRGLVSRPGIFFRAGAVWGMDFVLSDLKLLHNPASLALTYVEAMVLRRSIFLALVEEHKGACPGLKKKVRRYCCWVAFQRALLKEAKRRRKTRDRLRNKEVQLTLAVDD